PNAIEEESVAALDEIRRTALLARQPRFGSRHVNLLAATIPANRERCQRAPRLRTGMERDNGSSLQKGEGMVKVREAGVLWALAENALHVGYLPRQRIDGGKSGHGPFLGRRPWAAGGRSGQPEASNTRSAVRPTTERRRDRDPRVAGRAGVGGAFSRARRVS